MRLRALALAATATLAAPASTSADQLARTPRKRSLDHAIRVHRHHHRRRHHRRHPVRHRPTPRLAYGQWAIPAYVVMCESHGQNLPPNSAGASGYYQIIPSTWTAYGGTGPAAYLASKPEQDQVAARIWREGGPTQWVCAG